jgi:hypothetical protein
VFDVTTATPLALRTLAEERCRPILEWAKADQALLFHLLAALGWTRDAARAELQKQHWWLS